MKKFNKIILLLLLVAPLSVLGGVAKINGKAPAYAGKKIAVHVYKDYLSMLTEKIAEAPIDETGKFLLNVPTTESMEIMLRIDGVSAIMYVQPDAVYEINYPDLESGKRKSFTNNQVEISFDTLQTYDINNLILDFESRMDDFMKYYLHIIGSPAFHKEIDTLKVYLAKVYKDVKDPYFRDYIFYSVASVEQIGGINVDMTLLKGKLYHDYLSQGVIKYNHPKFMQFFNQYYTDVFKLSSESEEIELSTAINYKKSKKGVDLILQTNQLLKSPRFREYVMMKALGEEFHSMNYYQDNVIFILDSIRDHSEFPEHRKIADNLIFQLTRLMPGYPAPDFVLNSDKGTPVSLANFKGKYIYLHFWATWNTTAMSEMKIMVELHKRYQSDIVFISVNMDDSENTWREFLKLHPEMRWTHLYYGNQPEIIDQYRIIILSQFYFIGPDGMMLQSPAYKPTPNGSNISIDQTFYNIWRRLHPRGNK